MRIVICCASADAGDRIEELASGVRGVKIAARTSTGRDTATALRETPVDMTIIDEGSLEVGLVARRQIEPIVAKAPLWVAFLDEVSTVGMVKATQYGYDDAIVAPTSSDEMARHLLEIKDRRRSVHINPSLGSIDVVPGLFTRRIVHSDAIDQDLVELLGQGLIDSDIARALHLPIQEIRNRLAHLLEINGLANRTQLATLHFGSRLTDRLF